MMEVSHGDHAGAEQGAANNTEESVGVMPPKRYSISKDTDNTKTRFLGRWRGILQQFDGETGVLLNKSHVDLWVGQ